MKKQAKMKSQKEVLQIIKEHYSFLKSHFGLKSIGVFGSVVKNSATPDSDIDLVVEFESPIGLRFVEFVEYLEKILGSPVDVLTKEGLKNIRVQSVSASIEKEIIYV